MSKILIRNEEKADYKAVEEMTRRAFWNLYVPGCSEHYLVHIMREHADFVKELDFVVEVDGKIVGNIMYTKTKLVDDSGLQKDILAFGPVCVLPEYQRMGYSKMLIEHSFEAAMQLGYDAVVIFGNPSNYVSRGFKASKKCNISASDGDFPTAMMVKELKPDVFDGRRWVYHDSPVMHFDEQEAERYDDGLEKLEKKYMPSQEEFYIYSNSRLK